VLVVMDTSESMSVQDMDQGTRLDAAIDTLTTCVSLFDTDGPEYQILGLDTGLYGCESPDQLIRWGSASRVRELSRRLSDLLADANDSDTTQAPSGVVLMTDGQFEDMWQWPDHTAWPESLASVVIGVGSTSALTDVSVTELRVPRRVPQGSVCSVDIELSCTGDISDPVRMDVMLDDKTVHSVTVDATNWQFNRGQAQQIVTCQWPMKTTGRHVWGARITPGPNDRIRANNEAWSLMDVVERQSNRVLLYSQRATMNVGKLRHVLASDPRVILDVCLDVIKNRWLSRKSSQTAAGVRFPYDPNEFSVYDLIVMVTSDDSQWDTTQINHLYDYVAKQGGGLILIADASKPGVLHWHQEQLRQLLPVTLPDITMQAEPALGVLSASQESRERRLFQGLSFEAHDLPVLSWPLGHAKPATSSVSVVDNKPAVCVHRVGQGQVCVVGLSKLFQLYREDQEGGLLFDLISTLVRLVTPEPSEHSNLRVFAERVGDRPDHLSVTAWVKDQTQQSVDGADVLVTLEAQVVSLTAMGRGRYHAVVPYTGPQSVVLHAEAQMQGQYLGESLSTVRLSSLQTEMSRVQLNEPMLQDLSRAMHGEYIHISDVEPSVFDRFEGRRVLTPIVKVTSVWPRWSALCVLCVLLCLGWSVRRSLGMG